MSKADEARAARAAAVFSALGDRTRLSVVRRLAAVGALSATALSDGAAVSRQAIAKHLHVLEEAGLVTHEKQGREVLYALAPERLDDAKAYLDAVSESWDRAIERLRRLVEG
jgi:DNA-binding transcriptional ArsR family regulator